ncbi:MAG: hypothetical protein CMB99_06035 [Flavobacteriaceae bacterium]|nr:hypothetical protein [Flavobacteriaceae bacterium]|tara:strand:- start:23102 stop:23299 length:198 start_codon:yes stop_codon:yes gene_type:complete
MFKAWKLFQYGYLIIAIICMVEGILKLKDDPSKGYLLIGFSIFITLVFLFKRFFRKKIEKRNQNQ